MLGQGRSVPLMKAPLSGEHRVSISIQDFETTAEALRVYNSLDRYTVYKQPGEGEYPKLCV